MNTIHAIVGKIICDSKGHKFVIIENNNQYFLYQKHNNNMIYRKWLKSDDDMNWMWYTYNGVRICDWIFENKLVSC